MLNMKRGDSVEKYNSNIILFDGVCNLCNGFVQFMIKHDKKRQFKFASLQSNIADQLIEASELTSIPDSVVVVGEGETFVKSDAVLYICKKLGGYFTILRIVAIFPKFIRDRLYDVIAKRRYSLFGKKESCMLPSPEQKDRFFE